jgi:hypothetical protein
MHSRNREFIIEWETTNHPNNAERLASAFSMLLIQNNSTESYPQAGLDSFPSTIKDQSGTDHL